MLPVNTISSGIRYTPADINVIQTEPKAEPHVGSSSELNTKLLKELIAQVLIPDGADKLEGCKTFLAQSGLDTTMEDFKNSKLNGALVQLNTANGTAQTSDDVAEIFANQKLQVNNTELALGNIKREVATNRTKTNYSVSQFMATKEKALKEASADEGNKREEISTHTSYAELWARMAGAIKNIKGDYVDFYADLMQKYTEMYEAYNKHVQKSASSSVTSGTDGNTVKFWSTKLHEGYSAFEKEVNGIDLGNVKNWDKMTPEERKSMTTTLEPAFKVNSRGEIEFNLDQYNTANKYPTNGINDHEITTASYQAWLASFNAGGSALQSNMQSFAQRYSQANSTFDNLNKVLSGAISSLADSAKEVIRAFG